MEARIAETVLVAVRRASETPAEDEGKPASDPDNSLSYVKALDSVGVCTVNSVT